MNELRRILSFVRRAVDDYEMIREGDRIAVGISGGKDSLTTLVALAALRHLEAHPELPERLRSLSEYARKGFSARGIRIRESALGLPTPIIPLYTYTTEATLVAVREVYNRGVYVNPVLPPATPEGEALLRTSYMASHTEAQLDEAMDVIAGVMKDFPA